MILGKNISLRFVETKDASFILNLRLKRGGMLSKTTPSLDLQVKWIENYKKREEQKEEYYFIIEDKNQENIGTVRIYNIIEDTFCWGSWLIIENVPFYCSIESALLVYDFAFDNLNLKNSKFDVDKKNKSVLKFHLNMGAKIVDESEKDFYFEYPKSKYKEIRNKYLRYLK